MKVLLIQPNSTDIIEKTEYMSLQYPINLGYIASSLQKAGHKVKMYDFNVINRKNLKELILKDKPDIVGLTSLTPNIYNAKNIISEIKKINSNLIIILGGIHATTLPIETMQEIPEIDYLIFGEGELTITELVEKIMRKENVNNVKGIVFRKGRKIIKNPPRELIKNLDDIPFPNRDLIPIELYKKHHVSRGFSRKEHRIIEIMTSRGCPNKCIFCAGHINYGFSVRFRSFENIKGEIEECINKYGINHLSIEDDTFTLNKELVKKLCNYFKEKNLTWTCNTRVNAVDYELLKMMVDSGCKRVTFGIESGSQEILNKNKKGITVEQVIKAVESAKKAKIKYIECDFIIGSHIDERLETIKETEKLIFRLMPDILFLSVLCPYPGTEIYKMMIERGYLKNPDWSQFTFFGDLNRYERMNYLTSKEMWKLQHKILKKYYSSPKYITSQLMKIRSLSELSYFGRLGISFFKDFILKKE